MKYSFLLVALVTMLGLTACNKPAASPVAYSGADKVAYDAAVEKCKTQAFDSRDKCVRELMASAPKK